MKVIIKGMQCNHCVKRVESALKAGGAKKVKIDLKSGEASFENLDSAVAEQIVTEAGYEIVK